MKNLAAGGVLGILLTICILFCCISLCFLSFFTSLGAAFSSTPKSEGYSSPIYSYLSGNPESENKILKIKINGIILTNKPTNPLFSLLSDEIVYGYEIKKQLEEAAFDENIVAIIVEVNSPGGTITGSQAIADGIKYYQEQTGNQVFGFGSGVVASGGYWAISGTDAIYLDTGSSIGSIGIILGPVQTYTDVIAEGDIITSGGITSTYFTAGEGKDFGNPYRGISEKERNIYQSSVNSTYEKFITKVSSERGIAKDTLRNIIGAHLYDEDKAMEYKLIDEISNRDDLVNKIAEENGLGMDYQFVEILPTSDFFTTLFGLNAITNRNNNPRASICSHTGGVLAIEQTALKVCE